MGSIRLSSMHALHCGLADLFCPPDRVNSRQTHMSNTLVF